MADDLQSQIDTARKAGYTDDQIITHLGSKTDLADKIKTAKGAGYASSEILQHLQTNPVLAQTTPPSSTPTPVIKPGASTGSSPSLMSRMMQGASDAFSTGKQVVSDTLEGAGSGMLSTAQGLYNLERKGVAATGLGTLPEAPQWLQEAAAPVQYTKDAQGKNVPTASPSTSFNVGRGAEQAAEFMVPEAELGLAGKAGAAVEGLTKATATAAPTLMGRMGGGLARAGVDALSSGAVSAVQTGGNLEDSENALLTQGITSGAFNTAGGLLKALPLDKLYLSKLKFPQRFQGDRVDDILDKAITEGILISKGGRDKIGMIEKLEKGDRDALIAPHLDEEINPQAVLAPVLKLRSMAESIGETGMVKQIDNRIQSFLKAKGANPGVPAQAGGLTPEYLALGKGTSQGVQAPENGMVRLYRGRSGVYSGTTGNATGPVKGQWFTADLDQAKGYGPVVYTDVPKSRFDELLRNEEEYARVAPGSDPLRGKSGVHLDKTEAVAAKPFDTGKQSLGDVPTYTPGTPGQPATPAKITVRDAIQAKDDFQLLASKFFGKFSEGKGEIRKLMSAGINNELADISPAYKAMNQNVQDSKLLKQAIDKVLDNNPSVFGDGRTALLAWWSAPAAIINGVMSSPYLRSAIAVNASRAAKMAPTTGRLIGNIGASQFSDIPAPPANYVEKR